MAKNDTLKVLHHCMVSPPEGAVPTTRLPLSFLDLPWLMSFPVQRLYFYDFPHATDHFMSSVFPSLKRSLSLTLSQFFPFAASLICPPRSQLPYILCDTQDSIPLTIAESSASHYNYLTYENRKDSKDFLLLVPELLQTRVLSDETRVVPLFALQLTLFPNEGLSIGVTFRHVAADGSAFHHFLRSWACFCRTGGDTVCFDVPSPFLDRAAIPDPHGLNSAIFAKIQSFSLFWNPTPPVGEFSDKVRATFAMNKTQIDGLKNWISKQEHPRKPLHMSTFVVACSLTWICRVKSKENCVAGENDLQHFIFFADCRNRLEQPLPPTYFGNCLAILFVSLKKEDLLGGNGIVLAANALGNRVRELEDGALKNAENWVTDLAEVVQSGNSVNVAGSPKFNAYNYSDFGWGVAKKTEVVHIGSAEGFSLEQSRNEKGGIEVGVALTAAHMDRFAAIWEQSLKLFST